MAPVYTRINNRQKSRAYDNYSAVELTTGFGLDEPVEVVRERVLAKRVEELKSRPANFHQFAVGELADFAITKARKRDFGFVLAKVLSVRAGGTKLRILTSDNIEKLCHVRQLRKLPMAPSWWKDPLEEKLAPGSLVNRIVDERNFDPRLHTVLDTEWSPDKQDLKYEVGDFVAYVDGGSVFIGRVTELFTDAVSLQDCHIRKRMMGRGRKKVRRLEVKPIFFAPDGTRATKKSKSIVAYRVMKRQVLEVVKVVDKVLQYSHKRLVVDGPE